MRVLVFGNPLAKVDSAAVKIAKKLEKKIPSIAFVHFDTSEDLEKEGKELVIMDAVVGLAKPRLIELEELELSERPLSLHGFDLLWTLLLLKKLGKVRKAAIIGVPAKKPVKESLPRVKRLLRQILQQEERTGASRAL
jgi:Ni,Fe-hydrogenase maturation factor